MTAKILLVDDEIFTVKVTLFRLNQAGYTVVVAKNGREALELAKTEKPDLILLDLGLPDMDGSVVCKTIRQDQDQCQTPIVLFTASTDQVGDVAKHCGADGYLLKPFETHELLNAIKQTLERKNKA